jgi:5'(3')-deoxyribonucleotidase
VGSITPAVIALDVDGVLLDIDTPWRAKYGRLSGHTLTKEEVTEWDYDRFVLPTWRGRFAQLRTPDLYDVALPIEGAQEGVRELLGMGHLVVAVTHDYASHLAHKRASLRRYFPELEHIVFAKEKRTAVRYDILVDDGTHNLPDILFAQPWNRSRHTGWRCWTVAHTWEEVIYTIRERTTYEPEYDWSTSALP